MQSISQKTLTRLVLKTVPSCKSWAPLTSPWQTSFCQNNHLLIKKNNIVFPASKEAKNHHKTADFNPTSAPHRSWTSGASQHRKRIFLLRNPERWTNHHLSRPTKVTHREKWLGGRWVEKSKWEITIVFIYIYIYTILWNHWLVLRRSLATKQWQQKLECWCQYINITYIYNIYVERAREILCHYYVYLLSFINKSISHYFSIYIDLFIMYIYGGYCIPNSVTPKEHTSEKLYINGHDIAVCQYVHPMVIWGHAYFE